MTGAGVAVHWLDGGWDNRPTLVANSNAQFHGSHVGEHRLWRLRHRELGAFRRPCHGLDRVRRLWSRASGIPHGQHLSHEHGRRGHTERSLTEKRERIASDANFAPLGAVDVTKGYAYREYFVVIDGKKRERLLPLYAISPIFTVVD